MYMAYLLLHLNIQCSEKVHFTHFVPCLQYTYTYMFLGIFLQLKNSGHAMLNDSCDLSWQVLVSILVAKHGRAKECFEVFVIRYK